MSQAQTIELLDPHSKDLLHVLLEAPLSSLELLSAQLSNEIDETPASLARRAIEAIHVWSTNEKVAFIQGHPRIGEKSNLSALSAAEQAKYATPPTVLKRLEILNAEYERRFEGLRYITFVACRTRAQIAEEMEQLMGISPEDQLDGSSPKPLGPGDDLWEAELKRAIGDIGRIAQDRASKVQVLA
ncbi:hypothetical protein FRC14_000780 [Serendipita sp. 396]|nr:hypothetical protein FRC14_000780 [Serendipita sp. 396]KAG8784737.1 hypothetical protein FRC15_002704 [Serendipita sp. 397]KAG8800860.1 hypothetical protein FRC16_001887 [Serendipita sp. 398]KAG8827232.1 hypothetical protein FRC19_004751 [Serendipita sp. 401]KAG8847913.1 hypothetical protein FRB91_011324 [Serendipita sp. 411]KAG8869310.1 hypothetical protein FRC20_001699 [Serendipita sp. 405]KAG9056872.1 hypothetical protein FS842_009313 [Serendipita sp. 407]